MLNINEAQAEQIKKDWEKFRSFCNKLGDRSDAVNKMLDHFEERLPYAPASSNKDYHCAFPGGLINHSLRVLSNLVKLVKTFDLKFSQESIILCALFHDFGKIGDFNNDQYIPTKENWKYERGIMYDFNKELQYMPNTHRTLFLFQHFGIKLTEEEFLAILLNDGVEASGNEMYKFREPKLSVYLHMADYSACLMEKEQSL